MKLIFAVCLLLPTIQVNAEQSTSPPSSIHVTGESLVSVKPDRVRIDVGVTTRAPQPKDAVAQNATRLTATLAALRRAVGPDADIKTMGYSLSPDYEYHPNGGTPTLKGYTVTNTVQVTLADLDKIGSAIDAATQSGANQINGIQFTLHDQQAIRAQALREAALKAQADVEVLATTLKLKVVRVLSVEESSPATIPVRPIAATAFRRAATAEAPTPIEPGTIDVAATVALTVEVGPEAR